MYVFSSSRIPNAELLRRYRDQARVVANAATLDRRRRVKVKIRHINIFGMQKLQ